LRRSSCAVEYEFKGFVGCFLEGIPDEFLDYVVLRALLVQHQRFKVVAYIENVVVVYDALSGGVLRVSFGYFAKIFAVSNSASKTPSKTR
jgi:hypothetical protein